MNFDSSTLPASPSERTRGQIYEKIAFDFCKIATVLLLLEMMRLHRYALPLTAATSAILFAIAHCYGVRQSRCVLQKPLLIAAFWLVVVIGWCIVYKLNGV